MVIDIVGTSDVLIFSLWLLHSILGDPTSKKSPFPLGLIRSQPSILIIYIYIYRERERERERERGMSSSYIIFFSFTLLKKKKIYFMIFHVFFKKLIFVHEPPNFL